MSLLLADVPNRVENGGLEFGSNILIFVVIQRRNSSLMNARMLLYELSMIERFGKKLNVTYEGISATSCFICKNKLK